MRTPALALRRRGGFTFLELMIVLVILGLIFSMGAIKLAGSLPKYALRTSAKNIGIDIEFQRMVAVSRGSWTGIRYHIEDHTGNSSWQTLGPAPLDYPEEPIADRSPSPRKELESGVRLVAVRMRGTGDVVDSGSTDVYFSPTGTTGSHVITVATQDGRMFTLSFNAITGGIDFYEGEGVDFEDFEG